MNAVLNHLWQSTAFVLVAAVVARWLSRNGAHVRYLIWLIASIKFLIPFAVLIDAGSRFKLPSEYAGPAILATVQSDGAPFAPMTGPVLVANHPRSIVTFLLGIWLCGVVSIVAVWCRRWLQALATVRSAQPFDNSVLAAFRTRMGINTPVRLMTSDSNLEPGVFGFRKPVLIIPSGLRGKLATEQIDSVIAHELCHIRRFDNLTALIHMLVEALFWFHPLVWWISARLLDERERACDEAVLRLGTEPQLYAESILKVCEHYLESSLACVAGITGSDLKKRMERIMNHRTGSALTSSQKWLLAALGVAGIIGPFGFGLSATPPLSAQTDDGISGSWKGTAIGSAQTNDEVRKKDIVLNLHREGNAITGSVYISEKGGGPISSGRIDGGRIRLQFGEGPTLELGIVNGHLQGTGVDGKMSLALDLVKVQTDATLADLSGLWTGYMGQGPQGPMSAVLYLKQDGQRLSGSLGRNPSQMAPLSNARIEGDHVRFELTENESKMSFDLALADGRLEGLATGTAQGQRIERTIDVLRTTR